MGREEKLISALYLPSLPFLSASRPDSKQIERNTLKNRWSYLLDVRSSTYLLSVGVTDRNEREEKCCLICAPVLETGLLFLARGLRIYAVNF